MKSKEFRSIEEWKKEYYPELFAKEKRKRNKSLLNLGQLLAQETIEEVKTNLFRQR